MFYLFFPGVIRTVANKEKYVTHTSVMVSKSNNVDNTLTLSAFIRMGPNSKFSVAVSSDEDEDLIVEKESTRSLVYIGRSETVVGFSAVLKNQQLKSYKRTWEELDGWRTAGSGNNWYFENTISS